ncbi:MAG: hypothetical protein ACMUIA_02490 [bacterium]
MKGCRNENQPEGALAIIVGGQLTGIMLNHPDKSRQVNSITCDKVEPA